MGVGTKCKGKFLIWSVIVRHRHHAFEITSFSCLRRPSSVVVVRHRRQILGCAMRGGTWRSYRDRPESAAEAALLTQSPLSLRYKSRYNHMLRLPKST
jgi:hypothetical protein